MRVRVLVLWAAAAAAAGRRGSGPHRDVRTAAGAVRGYPAPAAAAPHYAFLGIPYGTPPIRQHEFKAPRAPPRWDGTFEATHAPHCPQPGLGGSQDCLVLNIFVPEGHNLPVVVIVHGGDFRTGWGATRAPDRFIENGVIVVTLNYRLGALGFLCLDSPSASGNAGAKDVLFALYWVHKNIESFGGDKYRITAYGIDSGAAIIEMLLLTGTTEGLIHRAILESGSILSPLSMARNPVCVAYDAAVSIGYLGNKTISDLESFYRNADPQLLTKISECFTFVPCVENRHYQNSILESDPLELLQSRRVHEIPLLIAYMEDGGTNLKKFYKLDKLPTHFEDLLPNNLLINDIEMKSKIAQLTKEFYFEDYMEDEDLSKPLGNYLNDITIEYPAVKSALLHATGGTKPVYLMKFLNGEVQGQDVIFKYFYSSENSTATSNVLCDMWSNFIKVGDPTPITTASIATIWLPVFSTEYDTITVATVPTLFVGEETRMGQPNSKQQLAFWDNIYKTFYNYNHSILNNM